MPYTLDRKTGRLTIDLTSETDIEQMYNDLREYIEHHSILEWKVLMKFK